MPDNQSLMDLSFLYTYTYTRRLIACNGGKLINTVEVSLKSAKVTFYRMSLIHSYIYSHSTCIINNIGSVDLAMCTCSSAIDNHEPHQISGGNKGIFDLYMYTCIIIVLVTYLQGVTLPPKLKKRGRPKGAETTIRQHRLIDSIDRLDSIDRIDSIDNMP